MRNHETFWTRKRLTELRGLFKQLSPEQLIEHYNREWEDILQAYEFQGKHRKMKVGFYRENGHPVTVYAPAHAYAIENRRDPLITDPLGELPNLM